MVFASRTVKSSERERHEANLRCEVQDLRGQVAELKQLCGEAASHVSSCTPAAWPGDGYYSADYNADEYFRQLALTRRLYTTSGLAQEYIVGSVAVDVRARKAQDAQILCTKQPGDVVAAVLEEDWLRLVDQQGYMAMRSFQEPTRTLLELVPEIKAVSGLGPSQSSCTTEDDDDCEHGRLPSQSTCTTADGDGCAHGRVASQSTCTTADDDGCVDEAADAAQLEERDEDEWVVVSDQGMEWRGRHGPP